MIVDNAIFQAFVKLGSFLSNFCDENTKEKSLWDTKLSEAITIAGQQNAWFTEDNVLYALKEWAALLTASNLKEWLSSYPLENKNPSKTVAIIMAGNIPLVGFHDFVCVLITGHKVLAKLSSNDKTLLPFIADFLIDADSSLEKKIFFTESKLEKFDAVIATGSNNTGRYFEYYFGKHPNIYAKTEIQSQYYQAMSLKKN